MATQNKKKILDVGFSFFEPRSKLKKNQIKLQRRISHKTHKNFRKSRMRATYNSMFYGY